jgi:hypothetical protein
MHNEEISRIPYTKKKKKVKINNKRYKCENFQIPIEILLDQ